MNREVTSSRDELHRAIESMEESVRELKAQPDSVEARRQLSASLASVVSSMPTEAKAELVPVFDRIKESIIAEEIIAEDPGHELTYEALAHEPMAQEAFDRREALAKKGELLKSAELQDRLGVSRQLVSKRVQEGSLFYVQGKGGVRYYPAFFADPNLDLDKVRKISKALCPLPGAAKWLFFKSPRRSLGGLSPLQVMQGKQAQVGDETATTTPRSVSLEDVMRAALTESQG